jgi:TolB-like protein/tetratricopeptide (TPR) repeat protein
VTVRILLHELKRRRVFRVAGIYGVVAWVLAEVADVVFPALQLPEWTVTFVIALLILGFPVAMIFAWVFDIGPGGIERTEPLKDRAKGIPRLERFAYLGLLAVAMGALAYFLFPRSMLPGSGDAGVVRDSIAVLPFANLSQDPDNDYFSDGMSEELLNLLARVPELRVASRTSSFAYKGRNVDVREVARQLGVDTVLEGSVRRSGDRVRITAQLIDAETGYHLWSSTYDRELQDIFAVQDEISGEIVRALKVTLGTQEEGPVIARTAPPTENLEAYQIYLQARHQWKRRGEKALERSVDLFRQALELDPEFARAYSGLAAAYVVLPGYAQEDPEPYFTKAKEAAQQALSRDANLAEAHAVLAEIAVSEQRWTDAEAGFFFATSLDPNDPTSHQWYSLLLRRTGRLEKALEEAQIALEVDPASPIVNLNMAHVYSLLGYDEKALDFQKAAMDLGFESAEGGDLVSNMMVLRSGDENRLRDLLREAQGPDGETLMSEELIEAIIRTGEDPAAWAEVDTLLSRDAPGVPEAEWFEFNLLAGRPEKAMEIALEYPDDIETDFFWLPEAAGFRRLPDFAVLVEKLGLLEYWKQYGWPDDCRPMGDSLQCGFATLTAAR